MRDWPRPVDNVERFSQFSGLVDNCEFKQGEKETTFMDLKGFWEMIYFQVIICCCGYFQLTMCLTARWKMLTRSLPS